METRNHGKINSSGHEGHGVHVCHKCGWPFPNPHPSAKHRRAHKRVCGTIEGYKLGDSGENQTHLDASDDDSKSPSNGSKRVDKTAELSISRSSSEVGDQSSRSTRSNEDVFSDAVTDFDDGRGVADSDDVGQPANVMPDICEDDGVTHLAVEKVVAVAGDLYPPNSAKGTQPQTVEYFGPENERVEIDMPSLHHLSCSPLDSISTSGLDATGEESSFSENMRQLQCSEIATVLDSEEKGSVEAAVDKKSEDLASIHSENASETSEAASLPQRVNGESLEFVPEDAAMEVTAKQSEGFYDKNECSPQLDFVGQIDSLEKGMVEEALDKKSEDIASIPTENAGKTSEAVMVPQEVNGDNFEPILASAAMEVKQGDAFDANNDCSPEGDFVGRINSSGNLSQATEDVNVGAGNSLETFDGHGSCKDNVHVLVVPDDLPLIEHSEVLLADHKTEDLPAAVTLEQAQEVKCVEDGKGCVTKDIFSSLSSAEPSESPNINSEDNTYEAFHQVDNSALKVSVEKKMEKTETDATNADIMGLRSVVADPDKDGNEVGQGRMVTSSEEQNPPNLTDTNLQGVLDVSDNQAQSIRGVKPVHDGSEHDSKDAEFSDAFEAEFTKVVGEELPLVSETVSTSDNNVTLEKNLLRGADRDDNDVTSSEVQEHLSEFKPNVPGSNVWMEDKEEVERTDEHALEAAASESSDASLVKSEFRTKKLEDSEAAVEDLGSNAVGASAISSIGDNVDMIEQKHDDENYVQKASNSADVGLFTTVMYNDPRLANIEVSEGPKELLNVGEKLSGGEAIGNVDLGLISDNDDSIDLTQNTANVSNSGGHGEAGPAVEAQFTKEIDGRACGITDGDRNLAKQEEAVPELDIQADSSSQSDSLECNWGSVSVLSAFSDAPAATDTVSQPSQASVKVEKASSQPKSNDGKSDIFEPPSFMTLVEEKADASDQNEGASEAQPSQKPQEQAGWFPSVTSGADESSGKKRNKEIIEKVTSWSTGKQQHMQLKSFLGESSPAAKDNPPLGSQKTERTMMDTKEPADEAAARELRKEWNSPARYPSNIKREKGKVRSRPYWVPFICCSSVQTS